MAGETPGWHALLTRRSAARSIQCSPLGALACVQLAQLRELLANLDFQPSIHRLVEAWFAHALGEIAFPRGEAALLVVRVSIVAPVVEVFHELGWRIAKMERH